MEEDIDWSAIKQWRNELKQEWDDITYIMENLSALEARKVAIEKLLLTAEDTPAGAQRVKAFMVHNGYNARGLYRTLETVRTSVVGELDRLIEDRLKTLKGIDNTEISVLANQKASLQSEVGMLGEHVEKALKKHNEFIDKLKHLSTTFVREISGGV